MSNCIPVLWSYFLLWSNYDLWFHVGSINFIKLNQTIYSHWNDTNSDTTSCMNYWIFSLQNQDIVNLVPHTEEQERSFVIYISIAFALKILDLLHLFIVQCTIDIFFIDWEKPRTRNLQNGDAEKPKEEPVSIWRTYFVANEWNEIQTLRKMNHTFTIVVVLFFLHVVGFGYVATMDPNSNFSIKPDIYRADDSRIFRFALGASIYMLVGKCANGLKITDLIWDVKQV